MLLTENIFLSYQHPWTGCQDQGAKIVFKHCIKNIVKCQSWRKISPIGKCHLLVAGLIDIFSCMIYAHIYIFFFNNRSMVHVFTVVYLAIFQAKQSADNSIGDYLIWYWWLWCMYWRKFELLYFHTINNSREHKLLVITEQGELEVDSFRWKDPWSIYNIDNKERCKVGT